MPSDDTIKLLNECNAGIKMGVESINEVIDRVKNDDLRNILNKYLEDNKNLGDKTHEYLNQFHDSGKEPNPIAKTMSWFKTNIKLLQGSDVDEQIADLMTDGCNMGIKSIYRYLNKYPNANNDVKGLAKDIIKSQEKFLDDLRIFL
ncbi:hypothetical protein EAI30_12675 [Romboutsia ilealis]|uniref:DUF2383 domain-containing protein n=1 Tax=Romboutsia faecis TaxID=2764597 RepID=A0ABR7JS98_9FIRM|nr:hypothetical protein [Romboutsia faecis]MBC5997771.1 hypothetical protein [Romboutsia faecis]MRN25471.1 hypothetical protein [Romboutsia ilealis]